MLQKAPGPPGFPLIGNLLDLWRDVLGSLLKSREQYGDVVRFRLGPRVLHLLAHPDHIEHVLLYNSQNYDKDTRCSAKIRSVTGEGLLTSNGDFWLRQRRLMQPAFAPQRAASFFDIMSNATEAMLDRWQSIAARGGTLDVASEMMRLTCTIVARALFGADISGDLDTIEQSATVLMDHAWPQRAPHRCANKSANARNLRRGALRKLEAIVERIIIDRRSRLTAAVRPQICSHAPVSKDRNRTSMSKPAQDETIRYCCPAMRLRIAYVDFHLLKHRMRRNRRRKRDAIGAPPTLDDLTRLEFTNRFFANRCGFSRRSGSWNAGRSRATRWRLCHTERLRDSHFAVCHASASAFWDNQANLIRSIHSGALG